MPATFINAGLILLGSLIGLLFKNFIPPRFSSIVTHALGLCVLGIGVSSAVGTQNALCVIVCMVVGTILGEALRIEDRLDSVGGALQRRLMKAGGSSRFTEGFMNASVLFCVGAMAITGSLNAGLNGDYTVLVSKGVIDGVTSITYAATFGVGTAWVGPYLAPAVITEMSAVGGTIIMGIAINMLGLGQGKIKVGNMLPAIFLPLAYLPLAEWLGRLMG